MVGSGGREDVSRLLDHDHGAGVCTRMASKFVEMLLGIMVDSRATLMTTRGLWNGGWRWDGGCGRGVA